LAEVFRSRLEGLTHSPCLPDGVERRYGERIASLEWSKLLKPVGSHWPTCPSRTTLEPLHRTDRKGARDDGCDHTETIPPPRSAASVPRSRPETTRSTTAAAGRPLRASFSAIWLCCEAKVEFTVRTLVSRSCCASFSLLFPKIGRDRRSTVPGRVSLRTRLVPGSSVFHHVPGIQAVAMPMAQESVHG